MKCSKCKEDVLEYEIKPGMIIMKRWLKCLNCGNSIEVRYL